MASKKLGFFVFCTIKFSVISTKNKIEAYKLTLILLLMSATHVRSFQVNELRFQLLKTKCGNEDKITNKTNVDITNMPPCNDSLRENV